MVRIRKRPAKAVRYRGREAKLLEDSRRCGSRGYSRHRHRRQQVRPGAPPAVHRRARRSCFLVDQDRTIRYKWLADHWLDPTRDTPPVGEIHEAIVEELGGEETPAF
ncbi:hypothetical protein [Halolamina salifodinae]|uniref:Uncharacterized protein n=1 Tax=Halolamina salifodinae TaxID=1202767 RepID=A0A8T4GTT3_9EURY|nr:hypothetical protein [Halolamina salifodinae]MBP1986447.1 hypothetical protein [Halolamina salifodinae]